MIDMLKHRNVVSALILCLPLIALDYFGIGDLGYFVIVPVLTLVIIILTTYATIMKARGGAGNG